MSRFAVMDPETGDWVEVTEEGIRLGLSLAATTAAMTPKDRQTSPDVGVTPDPRPLSAEEEARQTHRPCDCQNARLIGPHCRCMTGSLTPSGHYPVCTVTELLATLDAERARYAALVAAAQLVMDVADLWADEKDIPLFDDIPVELHDPLAALRVALDEVTS
jgi:hypothetical protein